MSKYWHGDPIFVIGLGIMGQQQNLSDKALNAIESADLVLYQNVDIDNYLIVGQKIQLKDDMDLLWRSLHLYFNKKVVILTEGDPLFHGIGEILLKRLHREELVFQSNISHIQAAFAKIGQPWQDAHVINLVGKLSHTLRSKLAQKGWYAILSDIDNPPSVIASELYLADYGASPIWVFENLGTEDEQITFDYADALSRSNEIFSKRFLMIFKAIGPGLSLPEFIGIKDDLFHHNADKPLQLSSHLRVNLLSLIATRRDDTAWVVGAGVGELAIEWARWCPSSQIHAIEYSKENGSIILKNRDLFGVYDNLSVHIASAPPILDQLAEAPAAIYVNVSAQDSRFEVILDVCWEKLISGGKLMVGARSENTKQALYKYADQLADFAEMNAYSFAISSLKKTKKMRLMVQEQPLFVAIWQKP
ncbi:precorrin-6Y C5,15-methyltransferase [Gammaproteobacteria bacterium]|nr:precorrin-6Y C5,15-methyltransferase [Gammaproteobacteria bacterium]